MLGAWPQKDVDALAEAGLLRSPAIIEGRAGPVVTIDGRQMLLFCSNDYLGLASHENLQRVGAEALAEHGAGASSSRLVCGTLSIHRQLEDRLARWLGYETGLLFGSAFTANLAILATLAGPTDVIISDELNHASIVQGSRLSRAEVAVYPHCDLAGVEALLQSHRGARRRFIVTDALFSVDGDVAPLVGLAALADEYEAALIVDEAHTLGVAGPEGRGLSAALSVTPDLLVGAFGKAFGVVGAFVATSPHVRALLESQATSYIYTTAPPPVVVALVGESLTLIRQADGARRTLLAHSDRLRRGLSGVGCPVIPGDWHIVPAVIPGIDQALAVQGRLAEMGIWVPALRPPTVRAGTERLRWTPSAAHSGEQIDRAIALFSQAYALGDPPSGR